MVECYKKMTYITELHSEEDEFDTISTENSLTASPVFSDKQREFSYQEEPINDADLPLTSTFNYKDPVEPPRNPIIELAQAGVITTQSVSIKTKKISKGKGKGKNSGTIA